MAVRTTYRIVKAVARLNTLCLNWKITKWEIPLSAPPFLCVSSILREVNNMFNSRNSFYPCHPSRKYTYYRHFILFPLRCLHIIKYTL